MTIDGQKTSLRRGSMDPDPFKQFARWFEDAEQAEIEMPNAMTLATADGQGRPSARIVLLKGVDARGFLFFTNRGSRKGHDLTENPFAALVFLWLPLSRQVRIEGTVELLEDGESDLYFASRPRGHQLEAHASPQSQIIKDRSFLDAQFNLEAEKYSGQDVPRPPHWGGYRLAPAAVEFWQEGQNRMHDRLRYRREAGRWLLERLAP